MCHNVSDVGTLNLLAQGGLPLPCEVFRVQASTHPPSRGGNRSLEGRVAVTQLGVAALFLLPAFPFLLSLTHRSVVLRRGFPLESSEEFKYLAARTQAPKILT